MAGAFCVPSEGATQMIDAALDRMPEIVQEDIGRRGLRTDPACNLITVTAGDFQRACRSLARNASPGVAIVTGFLIPTAEPPAGETDGPLGAVFLARALVPLRFRVALVSDAFCIPALKAGLVACGMQDRVAVVALPEPAAAQQMASDGYYRTFLRSVAGLSLRHLLTIERVGPSHTPASVAAQPATCNDIREFDAEVAQEHRDRCHTMRGVDITDQMSPAHWLFEAARRDRFVSTIGIGDGGNEIGMGRIGWSVIRRNIPRGGMVACRVATDHLIVAGVSNWGAYALAAGVHGLRGLTPPRELFDPAVEYQILEAMVTKGSLVDGVLAKPSVSVDGLTWDQYTSVLPRLRAEL